MNKAENENLYEEANSYSMGKHGECQEQGRRGSGVGQDDGNEDGGARGPKACLQLQDGKQDDGQSRIYEEYIVSVKMY